MKKQVKQEATTPMSVVETLKMRHIQRVLHEVSQVGVVIAARGLRMEVEAVQKIVDENT